MDQEKAIARIASLLQGYTTEELTKLELGICKILIQAGVMTEAKYDHGGTYFQAVK